MKKINLVKILLLTVIFLLPIFILPNEQMSFLGLARQSLLIILVSLAFILWLVKVIFQAEISYPKSWFFISLILMLILGFLSALFSNAFWNGFWGANGGETESLVNLLMLAVFLFLLAVEFNPMNQIIIDEEKKDEENKEIGERKKRKGKGWLKVFDIGYFVILFLLTLYGYFLAFGYSPKPNIDLSTYNPFGTINGLAIFLAVGFIYFLIVCRRSKNTLFRAGLSIFLGSLYLVLALMELKEVFIGLSVVIFALIIFEFFGPVMISKAKQFQGERSNFQLRDEILKLFHLFFLFILSTFLVFNLYSNTPLHFPFVKQYPEIKLSPSTSFTIVKNTYKHAVKDTLIGSGPNTFGYQYEQYKPKDINRTDFWQIRFNQASNEFFTRMVSGGLLGILIFVLFLIFALVPDFSVFKKLFHFTKGKFVITEKNIFSFPLLFLIISLFFTPLNFINFFWIVVLAGLLLAQRTDRRYKPSQPQYVFILIISALILIILSGFLIFTQSKRIYASFQHKKGVELVNQNKTNEGIVYLEKAINFAPTNENYLSDLIISLLLKMQTATGTDLQTTFSKAETAAINLKNLNKKEPYNFILLGRVYEAVMWQNPMAQKMVEENYIAAKEKAKNNPIFSYNLGRFYFDLAQKEADKKLKKEEMSKAKENLQIALDLKPNYFEAMELLKKIK